MVAIERLGVASRHLDLLAHHLVQEWPAWYDEAGPGDARADLQAWAHDRPALPLAMVALEGDVPVGLAALKAESVASHRHLAPWAAAGWVRADRRRAGIGARLLAALQAQAGALGFEALYCGTATADTLLARTGWEPVADGGHQGGEAVRIWRRALLPSLVLPAGRWLLRPFVAADAPAFAQAVRASSASVGRWMDWATPDFDHARALTWFDACTQARAHGRGHEFGIFTPAGDLVGGCGVNDLVAKDRRANLGYWVHAHHQGQGVATAAAQALAGYAFEALGLHRLEIVAAVDNMASQAVARRCGAQHEGTARGRLQIGGQARDAQVFGLVAGSPPCPDH